MHSCRRPFQDCASLCDRCATPSISDRFNSNAKSRAEQARQGRLTLLALAVIIPILSFTSLYAVAAVVDQGIQNWNSTRIANVEP